MHLAVEQIVDYFLTRLIEEEQKEVELHLADCDQCVNIARKIYRANSALEMLRKSDVVSTYEEDAAIRRR